MSRERRGCFATWRWFLAPVGCPKRGSKSSPPTARCYRRPRSTSRFCWADTSQSPSPGEWSWRSGALQQDQSRTQWRGSFSLCTQGKSRSQLQTWMKFWNLLTGIWKEKPAWSILLFCCWFKGATPWQYQQVWLVKNKYAYMWQLSGKGLGPLKKKLKSRLNKFFCIVNSKKKDRILTFLKTNYIKYIGP